MLQTGMVVAGPAGRIGVVAQVDAQQQGAPRLLVQHDNGTAFVLEPGSYTVDGEVIRVNALAFSSSGLPTQPIATHDYATRNISAHEVAELAAGERLVVPVVQEEINVERRVVERGGVRVHKNVTEREEIVEEPVFREEVSLERIPIGRPVETMPAPREEGDTLIIPVVEEMLVVEKRLVLKEEVRITKRRVVTTEQTRVVLRAEDVEIEQIPDPGQTRTVGDEPLA